LIDLTQPLVHGRVPCWDGGCGFEKKLTCDYDPEEPSDAESSMEGSRVAPISFRVNDISMHAGIGTHVDSPSHCFRGQADIASLQLRDLISPCYVIRPSGGVPIDENLMFALSDILQFEDRYGKIREGSFVVFHSGWDKHWNDPEKYRNNLIFPSVSEDAAEYLVSKGVSGIGIDTLSADCDGTSFPVHRLVLGSGRYLVENLTNLEALPPTGATIFVLPMKLVDCTEAPARVIAML
jgi:kynurenine formamidase